MSARSLLVVAVVSLCVASCDGAKAPTKGTDEPSKPVKSTDASAREPIDIVLAIDLSKSMEEPDLPRDRLDATQRSVRRFVANSKHDRFALVIYAQKAMLKTPLTSDAKGLDQTIANLRIGDVPELGTAMGDGLSLAVDELRTSTARQRVVILLADGESNWVTRYDPDQAAAYAKSLGIRVFTVLVGSENADLFGGMAADPATFIKIAETTEGRFHRATDLDSFDRALQDVRDKLEASTWTSDP